MSHGSHRGQFEPFQESRRHMDQLLTGIHQFRTNVFQNERKFFETLASGQHPSALFIGCSDSRVDPSIIMQAQLGELFVLRNAGNIVPCHGASNGGEPATIEYAVRGWLSHAEATRLIVTENYPKYDGHEQLEIAVREHVLVQIENLQTHPAVAVKLQRGELTLHAWIYQMETGEVLAYSSKDGGFAALTELAPHEASKRNVANPRKAKITGVRSGRIKKS